MKTALVLLPLLLSQPAQACHRFSEWRFPFPQRCGSAHVAPIRMASFSPRSAVPVPPVPSPPLDFILPALTDITWNTALDTTGQLELLHDMDRLVALRRLEEEMQ